MKQFRFLISAALLALASLSHSAMAADTRPFDKDSFAQIRAQHAGKPLVVHVWGMTCGPCLIELPKWSELQRKRPDMNLVLIEADQAPVKASEQTLAKAGLAKAQSWMVASTLDEFMRASIDPKWMGDMPRTLLIDATGKVTTLPGVADLATVNRWLDDNAAKK
ncbi:MAG: hypothetical protein JWP52_2622 [Rhizobacter sp.]|nr:hypothetical protein [Rhizobacter sp.]